MPVKTTVKKFTKQLIDSIRKESRHFDMAFFTKKSKYKEYGPDEFDYADTPTCGTASCIAGHIQAMRPRLAAKIRKELSFEGYIPEHDVVAAHVWEQVTGKECRFDFFGRLNGLDFKPLDLITREEAIAHIRGKNENWPLLPSSKGEVK